MFNLNKEKQLISKSEILKYYNELEIFQYYIEEKIVVGKVMLSPLRDEKNASFGFFVGEGNEVCFKDFILGSGDFVQFLRLRDGLTYFEALSKIANDFNIQDEYICKSYSKINIGKPKIRIVKDDVLTKYTGKQISKRAREWKSHDVLFWKQFGIGKETLELYKVQPIDFIFTGDNCFPADKYAYCFIEIKDGVETYKIYQPYNDKYKWMNSHNDSVWQGWTQLPQSGHNLVITKSLKDVMALHELGFTAVSLQSENLFPKKHVFKQLEDRFKYIEILYDNDYDSETNWGKLFGDKLAKELGLSDCYIPDKYEAKDTSDLIAKYGKNTAKEIISKEVLLPF